MSPLATAVLVGLSVFALMTWRQLVVGKRMIRFVTRGLEFTKIHHQALSGIATPIIKANPLIKDPVAMRALAIYVATLSEIDLTNAAAGGFVSEIYAKKFMNRFDEFFDASVQSENEGTIPEAILYRIANYTVRDRYKPS